LIVVNDDKGAHIASRLNLWSASSRSFGSNFIEPIEVTV
jgi:hypothetical protein